MNTDPGFDETSETQTQANLRAMQFTFVLVSETCRFWSCFSRVPAECLGGYHRCILNLGNDDLSITET